MTQPEYLARVLNMVKESMEKPPPCSHEWHYTETSSLGWLLATCARCEYREFVSTNTSRRSENKETP